MVSCGLPISQLRLLAPSEMDSLVHRPFVHGFQSELHPMSERMTLIRRHYLDQQLLHICPFVLSTATQLVKMELENMYDFCQKGCAVYITTPLALAGGLTSYQNLEMFNYLYKALGQQTDLDLASGSFPCKFIASWARTSPKEVGEILDAHRRICDQVATHEDILNSRQDYPTSPGPHSVWRPRHELHPLFRALLVVMDKPGWQENDVRLIRTGDDHDLRSGPIDFDPLRFNFYVDDDGDVLRGSFQKVMSLIMDMKQREDDAKICD